MINLLISTRSINKPINYIDRLEKISNLLSSSEQLLFMQYKGGFIADEISITVDLYNNNQNNNTRIIIQLPQPNNDIFLLELINKDNIKDLNFDHSKIKYLNNYYVHSNYGVDYFLSLMNNILIRNVNNIIKKNNNQQLKAIHHNHQLQIIHKKNDLQKNYLFYIKNLYFILDFNINNHFTISQAYILKKGVLLNNYMIFTKISLQQGNIIKNLKEFPMNNRHFLFVKNVPAYYRDITLAFNCRIFQMYEFDNHHTILDNDTNYDYLVKIQNKYYYLCESWWFWLNIKENPHAQENKYYITAENPYAIKYMMINEKPQAIIIECDQQQQNTIKDWRIINRKEEMARQKLQMPERFMPTLLALDLIRKQQRNQSLILQQPITSKNEQSQLLISEEEKPSQLQITSEEEE